MEILRRMTNVQTITSVRKTFISVAERWLRTYITDALQYVSDCYIREVLDDGQIELRGVLIERYEACEEAIYDRVVGSTSKRERRIPNYRYFYCVQLQVQVTQMFCIKLIPAALTAKYTTCNLMAFLYAENLERGKICIKLRGPNNLEDFLNMDIPSCNQ